MKSIMNRRLWSFVCFALLGTAACSDDDTETRPQEPTPPAIATENLPESGLKFLYSAQTAHTFTLSSDAPWEITKTAGWFVVTPNKGEAGQQIGITITPALNQGEARDGAFTIRANSGNNLHPCLTEKTVTLAQDAYLAAGIVITGLDERTLAFEAEETDPVVFTVEASYDWTIEVENGSWLTVTPTAGNADTPTEVRIVPQANTTAERHEARITITAGDAGFSENSAEETIELIQAPYIPKDSHEAGYVFFNDDFQWIQENWVSPYTKYGWPSVSIDGTNNNEFALSTDGMKEAVAERGYDYTASVYARYEGHLKLGKTANKGAITTPALSGIDNGKAATLLVQFDAAMYSSAGGTVDNGDDCIDIAIVGPGTIGGLTETTATVEVKNVWEWTRYSLIVYGATSQTRITFGSEREVKCRLYLDNLSVARADDDATEAPAAEPVVTPLDKQVDDTSDTSLYNEEKMVVAAGGTLKYTIRVNREWTAESDSEWLTITSVRCGDKDPYASNGANNGASLADGVATVKATGLPYVNTKIEVAKHKGAESRTGYVIIKSEGQEIDRIAVTQASGAQITLSGIKDNTVELSDDPQETGAVAKFTLNAPYAWTIAQNETASWYEISPMQGAADTDVEVTIRATEQNLSFRRSGSLTITSAEGETSITEQIALSQRLVAPGKLKWDMSAPVQWSFSADEMAKYSPDFQGVPNDPRNMVLALSGPGYLSYTHTAPSDPADKCSRTVGNTGHPYITGGWPGDYWTFSVAVARLEAGTRVQFTAIARTSATGHKFWRLEYNDGGAWKPACELKTTDETGESVSYTHAMNADGKTNITVDATVTYENAITDGNIEFRFVCAANWQASGKGALTQPNGGTMRWAGAGTADSPRIQIVP